MTCNFKDVL